MYKALFISPMIPSFDLQGTISFFQNLLEFEIVMEVENYAILHKDQLSVHILRAGPDIGEMEFYLQVDSLEPVWKRILQKPEGLKYREPFDRDYGMREIHIIIPSTKTLLFVGEVIK